MLARIEAVMVVITLCVAFCIWKKGNWKWLIGTLGGLGIFAGGYVLYFIAIENAGTSNYMMTFETYSLVIGIILFVCIRIFNEKAKVYSVINFNPPRDMNSALAGYIYDQSLNKRDLNSIVVYLYSKKYIDIIKENNRVYIKKNKSIKIDACDEHILFSILPKQDELIPMSEIEKRAYSLREDILRESKKYFDKKKCVKFWILFFISILFIACFSWAIATHFPTDNPFDVWGVGLVLTIFFCCLEFLFIRNSLKIDVPIVAGVICFFCGSRGLGCLLYFFIGVPISIFTVMRSINKITINGWWGIGIESCIMISCLIFIIKDLRAFSFRNDLGNKIYKELLGLKKFLEKVEKDKFDIMCKEDPQYLRSLTPYIYIFNLNDKFFNRLDIDISKFDIEINII